MYAVIQSGGKQYKVAIGDVVQVESLPAQAGDTVQLDKVLLVSDGKDVTVGTPYVDGTAVTATVRGHGRGEKIVVFKMRRRKDSQTRTGHRQNYTELEVTGIGDAKAKAAPNKKAAATDETKAAPKKKATKKAAPKKAAAKKES